MNLHQIVSGAVSAINPWVTASIQMSAGYTTAADGSRAPAYAPAVSVQVQAQALTYKDLMQIDGLNLNGEKKALYINGNWEGVSRPDGKGGDLITMPDGSIWLIAQVLENWGDTDGWVKVAVVKQDGN